MDIKDVLIDLGYKINDCGNYWTCQALYRDGQDPTSVAIYPNDNLVLDFVAGEKFSIETLIAKTIGIKTEEEVRKFLTQKSCVVYNRTHFNPEIQICKTYNPEMLKRLIPDHSYWTNRGISENIVSQFRGGVCQVGKYRNRYVFPIFRLENSKTELIGFTGRSLNPKENKRWLHHGSKSFWVYPNFLNHLDLYRTRQVILVEGIGDNLSLWECGIRNTQIVFGIEMCKYLLIYLLKINPSSIVISFNNDAKKSNAGNNASEKLKRRLCNYFSEDKIKILLPQKHKDWNDVLINQGRNSVLEQFAPVLNF